MRHSPQIAALVRQAERETARRPVGRARSTVHGSRRRTGSDAEKARDSREAARGRLELARYRVRKAREQTRATVAALRARYRASRPALRVAVTKFRDKWRAWVNEQVAGFRAKHAAVWRGRIAAAQLALARARYELAAERGNQRELRETAKAAHAAAKANQRAQRDARKHGSESDYYVAANLPPELIPVWQKAKRKIRTTGDYQSRTEAFLGWVHDHPDEVAEIRERDERAAAKSLDRELSEQEARHYREQLQ
jgi:hypothetical protein